MNDTIPTGRLSRTLSTGKVAARMGTNQMRYLIKRPFLSERRQQRSKEARDAENAKVLFKGLSLLRGTALKAAQMLSFEREILPEAYQKELKKSYAQVPPINRALIRKLIINGLGAPPERLYRQFDTTAFAAASLGQVHRAVSNDGEALAVKVQYPDMHKTIDNDMRLLHSLVRPMAEYHLIKTALEEVREVLLLETDYTKEAEHIDYFRDRLNMDNVRIPKTHTGLCSDRILTMSLMEGRMLDQWLKTGPGQAARNQVAQILNDIFIRGFYELNIIHADPNPGNFLVMDGPDSEDLSLGLLDFGCVRRIRPEFVAHYAQLIRLGGSGDREAYWSLLVRLGLLSEDLDPALRDDAVGMFMEMGAWINLLFRHESFDFSANPDFMARGRELGRNMQRLRRLMTSFPPAFVFIDRTRYGLIRLYEQMGVKIRLRNTYEYNDEI